MPPIRGLNVISIKIDQQVINRFDELIEEGNWSLKNTKWYIGGPYTLLLFFIGIRWRIRNIQKNSAWGISSLSFLEMTFGKDSDFYKNFERCFLIFDDSFTANNEIKKAIGYLMGAKQTYQSSFRFHVRDLVQAEIFEDLLDQAQHLLDSGYFIPAAVLSGCVLEDGLRKLCPKYSIPVPAQAKLNSLNDELGRKNAYDASEKKKVTWLAGLRNDAAHGQWVGLTPQESAAKKGEVEKMIPAIRSFVTTHLP